jgi:general secretion pathway protein F
MTLAEVMSRAGSGIPSAHAAIISAAERSGSVDAALRDLADFMDLSITMRRRIQTGLILPGLVFHAAVFVAALPNFILRGTLADYIASTFGFLAVMWIGIGAAILVLPRLPGVLVEKLVCLLPLIGRTWREVAWWRFAMCMRMLTNAGIGAIEATRFCAGITHSPRLASVLRRSADMSEAGGQPVSIALNASGEFPPEMMALWSTGEESGQFDSMLDHIARQTSERCELRMKMIAEWAPRVVYGMVCLYVIYQIFQLAGRASGLGGMTSWSPVNTSSFSARCAGIAGGWHRSPV